MARIFISHSSKNNDRAIELRDWLQENGWTDIFLDLDPERGIAAGQRAVRVIAGFWYLLWRLPGQSLDSTCWILTLVVLPSEMEKRDASPTTVAL